VLQRPKKNDDILSSSPCPICSEIIPISPLLSRNPCDRHYACACSCQIRPLLLLDATMVWTKSGQASHGSRRDSDTARPHRVVEAAGGRAGWRAGKFEAGELGCDPKRSGLRWRVVERRLIVRGTLPFGTNWMVAPLGLSPRSRSTVPLSPCKPRRESEGIKSDQILSVSGRASPLLPNIACEGAVHLLFIGRDLSCRT
jgi:hypothetical protein